MKLIKPLIIILILAFCNASRAQEVIEDFFSDIQINTDGSMNVTETIKVKAENKDIKRGIYRDFPTRYKDVFGNNYSVAFELLSVTKNKRYEPHHTETRANGVRIYIGNKNVTIKPGYYTYTIQYKTSRQLGFFADHDELYWNVTGNEWNFPIIKASAKIEIPPGVTLADVNTDAYTGPTGSKDKNFEVDYQDNNQVVFKSTISLEPREGMTVVVGWPKGYVTEPELMKKIGWFFFNNQKLIKLLIGFVGVIFLFIYYYRIWVKVGKDPAMGIIYPHYTPEAEHSPASMRYLMRMGYDKKTFTTALVNLAVKGYLTITEDENGEFTLTRTGNKVSFSPGEKVIAGKLFAGGDSFTFKKGFHGVIKDTLRGHEYALEKNYDKIYFNKNVRKIVPGWLLTILFVSLICLFLVPLDNSLVVGIATFWLLIWSVAAYDFVRNAISAWKGVYSIRSSFPTIMTTLGAIGSVLIVLVTLVFLLAYAGFGVMIVLVSILIINFLFFHLMKAPTLLGQKLRNKIKGFRYYLRVAEEEELQMKSTPEKTPELFEQYLPYAMALDVEEQWSNRFTSIFNHLEIKQSDPSPSWYSGRRWSANQLGSFSTAMGSSLSTAVSSYAQKPGSSSGFGSGSSGGSSGGGGGGGGGGGW